MADREYTLSSTAWPRSVWVPEHEFFLVDELLIDPGSVHIKWVSLNDTKRPSAMVEAFDDAWTHLASLRDMFVLFAAGDSPTPQDVIAWLDDHGYVPSDAHGQLDKVRE